MDRRTRSLALLVAVAVLSGTITNGTGQEAETLTGQVLASPDFTWRTVTDGAVRLHYQPDSFAERHRVMLARSAVAAVARCGDFLGSPDTLDELHVFYVDDRQQMERLIGRPYSGYSDWTGSGVFLVCTAEWRSFDTHEIAHVLSIGPWGWPTESSRWMVEGLPIAVDGWCRTFDIDTIAHHVVQTGAWPGLDRFSREYAELGEIRAGVLAASLILHVREAYGPEAIELLWSDGPAGFAAAHGIDLDRLEADWHDHLGRVAEPLTDEEWRIIDDEGCG